MNIPIPNKLRMLKRHLVQRYGLFRRWDDKRSLIHRYRNTFGRDLDLVNPQTFTEKLFHQMINVSKYGNPLFTRVADKYLVRDYVHQKLGSSYLVKLLWSGVNPSDIPFDSLPDRYVIKTNNGSGKNIFVKGSIDRRSVTETLHTWLTQNYHSVSRECHYLKIEPRVIVEEFMDDGSDGFPIDYRFWCFGGRPEMIQIDNNDHSIDLFYDIDWNRLQLRHRDDNIECDIPRPDNFEEMLLVASKLASDFAFVRVDLYNLRGRIKFGELTLHPRAGDIQFKPGSWDALLGQKWVISS
jgi:TupA-like ATPgrasp